MTDKLEPILKNVFRFVDTCNVYMLKYGARAVLVDFGSGDVLNHLAEAGVQQVTDILMTHHHRDQAQGLSRANEAGIRIWVPHTEQDLFHSIDAHWQAREIYDNYNTRQDRFSLLESVAVTGTLQDYDHRLYGDFDFLVLPTPGHTTGSVSLLVEIDERSICFTGDLIFAPGKIWSLSATQWTYNGAEGVAATVASLLDMRDRQPDLILPSHGDPFSNPGQAIDLLVERLWMLLRLRQQDPRLFQLRQNPYKEITPHLLFNRASDANTYVLLSASGKALFIDFGYDFPTGLSAGSDRASRRPWLYTLPVLKRCFGVYKVDVVIPTHYHDDHVAGINLLRNVEGTQVWAAEIFADILMDPASYDLPCLWYDPIPIDRRLPLEQPIQWEEYSFTLYPLPGHTLYAIAIALEVNGKRILATGDQYQEDNGLGFNYVYQNRFRIGDYAAVARLYSRLQPDLILPGHWQPLWITPKYLNTILEQADLLESLHRDLLPTVPDLGAEGFLARIKPYQATARAGEPIPFEVEIRNPFSDPQTVTLRVIGPTGWQIQVDRTQLDISELIQVPFRVISPPEIRVRRARIAVDVTIGDHRFGQQAEALVTLL